MAERITVTRIHDIEWSLSRADDHINAVNNKVKKCEARLNNVEKEVGMIQVLAEEILKLQKIVQPPTKETDDKKNE